LGQSAGEPSEEQPSAAALMDDLMWGRGTIGGPLDGLIDQTGAPRSDRDFLGRPALLYFGYTYCADICPIDLQAMTTAVDLLGAEGLDLQILFITLDPERDTVEHLAGYTTLFHEHLIGLQERDLSVRRYVYLWADGVYFAPRLDHDRQCILVLIGADAQGHKELLAIDDGYRESTQSWRELLIRLRDKNGLVLDPEVATGDGALGFWQALHQVWPKTRQQRCWVHKTANVLNVLPKSLHAKAKQDLHAIYEAERRQVAEAAFDHFAAKYGAKYDKAVACLAKDRGALLAFYDFPAEHWKHVRTSNPIESTFATVRLRTDKTKGCLSRPTALALVFKLAKSAERHWRRLDGSERLGQLIEGIRFRDGEPVAEAEDPAAA
jgi:hypothetical protein